MRYTKRIELNGETLTLSLIHFPDMLVMAHMITNLARRVKGDMTYKTVLVHEDTDVILGKEELRTTVHEVAELEKYDFYFVEEHV